MANDNALDAGTVELPSTDGVAFVGSGSPLTRLHYFDGQFLRASALTLEQDYHRQALRLANIAGGWGAVHGLGIALAADRLQVGAGLAITAAGSFVLAPDPIEAKLADLLKVAAPPPPAGSSGFADCLENAAEPAKLAPGVGIYEITVGPIEGLCGNEPVYGKLCDSACATDSRHPYWREGVVLRLRPLTLALPTSSAVAAGTVHLRNRIASAYFAAEPWLTGSLLSATGLASDIWCQPAQLYERDEVVIGLLAREGATVRVLDAWSGRRERMDAQARGYWQGRMAMRPWNVFLAQILQFQCQLAGLFDPGQPVILPADDCDQLRELLTKARQEIEVLLKRYGGSTSKLLQKVDTRPTLKEYQAAAVEIKSSFADLDGLSTQLAGYQDGMGALPQQRMLLNAGFFELPPAGYLPVSPNDKVQEQLQRMFGEGVKLDFHAVAADEIGHLVEQAQHMRRISLTRGLDDPRQLEPVEIFVPDGEVLAGNAPAAGTWWRATMLGSLLQAAQLVTRAGTPAPTPAPTATPAPSTAPAASNSAGTIATGSSLQRLLANLQLDGLLRSEARDDGTSAFTMAVSYDALQASTTQARLAETTGRIAMRVYAAADVSHDPFDLPVGGTTTVSVEERLALASAGSGATLDGTLTVLNRRTLDSGVEERLVQADLRLAAAATGNEMSGTSTRVRLLLQRDGNARTGVFIVDDEAQDPATSPIFFEWDDAPRRAVLYVDAVDDNSVKNSMQKLGVFGEADTQPRIGGSLGNKSRRELLQLSALPSMPDPASAIATSALEALAALADATDDAAFLMRSRLRLFPTLDTKAQQVVRARQDWVMFRRARTALCGPACIIPASTATEVFQAWHLRLKTSEQLAPLVKALDQGDAKVLAQFRFQRVGLLRYRDESAFAEEAPDRVLAMWDAVRPAPQVGVARIWELAPQAGQGWQNHMRLRNMLDQIQSLTQPPARGSGAIGAIAPPPGLLGDDAYDGGMLVVTIAATTVTRNAVLIYASLDGDNHYANSDSPQGPLQFVDNVPQGTALADFIGKLGNDQTGRGVALATTKAAPDADAPTRLAAVVAAIAAAGKQQPPAAGQRVIAINDHDRAMLKTVGVDPDTIDEVFFFE